MPLSALSFRWRSILLYAFSNNAEFLLMSVPFHLDNFTQLLLSVDF